MTTGASRINVKWVQGQQTVTGVDTSRAGAVGITERGPIGTRTTVFSKEEFRRFFGGYVVHAASDLSISVDSFFDNGGTALDVVRTCHYTSIGTDPDSYTAVIGTLALTTFSGGSPTAGTETSSGSETFELANGDTILINPDAGGDQTFTLTATAGTVATSNAWPVADQTTETITITADGGTPQIVPLTSPATTAEEVANQISAAAVTGIQAYVSGGHLNIRSDTQGSGSTIVVATSSSVIIFGTPTAGTGNVISVAAVTGAEIVTVTTALTGATVSVEGTGEITVTSATTGLSSSVQITGTAQTKIGFDGAVHSGSATPTETTLTINGKTHGSYANDLYSVVSDASNGDAEFFNFSITKNGEVQEAWANVTMDSTHSRYVVDIVNHVTTGSDLISLVDADLIGGSGYTATEARPTNGTLGPLTGGDDGLTSLVDSDFVGSSATYTGLYALDNETGIRLLTVPGHASATVHAGLNAYIIHREKGLYVVHPTPGPEQSVTDATTMKTWADSNLYGTTEFGCCAWPRIKVANPSTATFGNVDTITIGSEMAKMGRFAYNDRFNPDGVLVSTAGIKDDRGVIINCLGVEYTDMELDGKADLLANVNIEPIRKFEGTAYHWDGGDNLKIDGDWPRQWHARGAIYVVQSIKKGALWVKHSKNNPKNRGDWERQGSRFLTTLPDDAFDSDRPTFWQVSDALNGPEIRAQQRIRGKLGLGFADDAKYVEIIVTRTIAQS